MTWLQLLDAPQVAPTGAPAMALPEPTQGTWGLTAPLPGLISAGHVGATGAGEFAPCLGAGDSRADGRRGPAGLGKASTGSTLPVAGPPLSGTGASQSALERRGPGARSDSEGHLDMAAP